MPACRIVEGSRERFHELRVGALVGADREGRKIVRSKGLDTYRMSREGTRQFSLAVEVSQER